MLGIVEASHINFCSKCLQARLPRSLWSLAMTKPRRLSSESGIQRTLLRYSSDNKNVEQAKVSEIAPLAKTARVCKDRDHGLRPRDDKKGITLAKLSEVATFPTVP